MTPEQYWQELVREFARLPTEPTEDDIAGMLTPSDVHTWMDHEIWLWGEGDVGAELWADLEISEGGKDRMRLYLNCVASGQPQPAPCAMLHAIARKKAAKAIYLAQDALRLEMESEDYEDAVWDDPVRSDRRALSTETRKLYG